MQVFKLTWRMPNIRKHLSKDLISRKNLGPKSYLLAVGSKMR